MTATIERDEHDERERGPRRRVIPSSRRSVHSGRLTDEIGMTHYAEGVPSGVEDRLAVLALVARGPVRTAA